jgi:glycine cleavage system aminomethyltransferase T
MGEHCGWVIPMSFAAPEEEAERTRKAVGLCDLSWTVKFDLQGRGLKTAPAIDAEAFVWRLGRSHYLVTCVPPVRDSVETRLQEIRKAGSDAGAPVYVTDVTSVCAQFLIAGPRSSEVLSKVTSLNLGLPLSGEPSSAQANVAHVHAAVLRSDLKTTVAYHLLVSREYGESVWESLLHAGSEFGITRLGLQGHELLHSQG